MSPEFRILFSTYLHYFRPSTTLSRIYLSLKSSCPFSAGSFEDGLSGSCGQTGHGLCPPDHGCGGCWTLEGAGWEAHQGFTPADGCLRGTTSRQERGGGQWGTFALQIRFQHGNALFIQVHNQWNNNQSKPDDTVFSDHSLEVCVEMPKQQ